MAGASEPQGPGRPAGADPTLTPAEGLDAPAPAAIRALGRYQLLGELGAGGMGVVYRAIDPALGRALAIKLVRPRGGNADARARFLREAQAMARLHHPNVVPIFDVGESGEQVFLVMPYLGGGTLGRWMKTPRPWREVVARFVEAGRGLVAAHDAGLIHRDFKPDNVMLGDKGEVQVADFGLARAERTEPDEIATARVPAAIAGGDLTQTGTVLGTPAYMAPEQLRGDPVDARADQFGFCVSLYEALHGRRPFDAGGARGADALEVLLDEILAGRIRPSSDGRELPRWLDDLLRRGLRPEPDNRWPSMAALLAEAERRLDGRDLVEVDQALVGTVELPGSGRPADGDRPSAPGATIASKSLVGALATAPRTAISASRRRWIAIAALLGITAVAIALWLVLRAAPTPPVDDVKTADDAALISRCDRRDGPACRELAMRELRRLDDPPDFPRVLALALDACDLDDADGCAVLSDLYALGNGVAPDYAKARLLAARACNRHSAAGCGSLGDLESIGVGGPLSSISAIVSWRHACDLGHAEGCRSAARQVQHGLGVEPSPERARKLSRRALALADAGCDAGDASACRTRGMLHYEGTVVPRDVSRAAADLERACEAGDPWACDDAGELYVIGAGVQADPTRGMRLLRRGCSGGAFSACNSIAIVLGYGQGVPRDQAEARKVAEDTCQRHGDRACSTLAAFHAQGIGVPQDLVRARQLYQRTCDAGDGFACEFMGNDLRRKNPARSEELTRRGCELGALTACLAIGDVAYDRGQDDAAFEAYRLACELSSNVSCDSLGRMYLEGRGVAQDVARGQALYEESCKQQDARACHRLGLRLRDGKVLAADPRAAVDRFEQACALSWGDACAAAADLLADGKALPADPAREAELRTKACDATPKHCPKDPEKP